MSSSISHILEQAIRDYLAAKAEFTGVDINTGDSADTQALPRIIVVCDSVNPPSDLPEGLGNYSASVRIHVISSADDETLSTHRARVGDVAGFMGDVTAVKASVSAGVASIYGVWAGDASEGRDERSWATALSYEVPCVLAS